MTRPDRCGEPNNHDERQTTVGGGREGGETDMDVLLNVLGALGGLFLVIMVVGGLVALAD